MLYYDPAYLTQRGGVELPSWIYMRWVFVDLWDALAVGLTRAALGSWAVGLFFYQALDAIDGYASLSSLSRP